MAKCIVIKKIKRGRVGKLMPTDLLVTGAGGEVVVYDCLSDAFDFIDTELDGYGKIKMLEELLA